jgi:hypothetical protein
MKQTAVDWLIEEIHMYPLRKIPEYIQEQANKMFEEQIKSAFTQGELFSGDFYDPNNPKVDCSENYYRETYDM